MLKLPISIDRSGGYGDFQMVTVTVRKRALLCSGKKNDGADLLRVGFQGFLLV